MCLMLNDSPARAFFGRLFGPIGRWLGRAGVHPNVVTVFGTLGTVAASILLIGTGRFFAGCMAVTFFVFLDLLDGALARATNKISKFGAVLDSTGDRLADAAIFGALAYWYGVGDPDRALLIASLLCLVFGQATSYVKARSEGIGIPCNVGIAERAERLIVVLVGIGVAGIGVPYILAIALWALTAVSAYTVLERLREVYRRSTEELHEPELP